MRHLRKLIILAAIILFTASGCKKFKDLLDVTFNAKYTVNIDAVIPPSTNQKSTPTFSASATIDPSINQDFSTYASKIKDIEITSVSAKILTISKPLTIVSANISVYSDTRNASWDFTDKPVNVGTILTLDNENGQWTTIGNILNDKNVFTVEVSGQTDIDDVVFTLEVTINSKITANPLGN